MHSNHAIMKNRINRRGFLKSTLIGTSGTIIGASSLNAAGKGVSYDDKKIITRKLGNTGIELPIVSMGAMRSGNPGLIKAAKMAGIIHFDTAHRYQNGKNEVMLGKILKEFPRDSYVIATKIRPADYDRKTGTIGPGATKEKLMEKINTSLERLQTDYVDILYFHGVGSRKAALHELMLDVFTTIKKQGKAKHIGLATHSNEPEVIQTAIDTDLYEVVLAAFNFKQSHAEEIKKMIALAYEKGVGIIGMKTMAGAFRDKDRTDPINCKAALKWVLQNPGVTTVIPGMVNIEQLAENMSVIEDLKLTEEEEKHLEEVKLSAGLYCDGCGECLTACKMNLPVNDIMRAYMYTYGYKQIEKAYSLLADYDIPENPCSGCTECPVICSKGFNVHKKITDVARLRRIPGDFIV